MKKPALTATMLALLIHLFSIPVTNTSVNLARSTGPALLAPAWAMEQLWMFWVAPLVGAVVGALIYRLALAEAQTEAPAIRTA